MKIRLSDHFNYGRLIKFVIPSVIMMVFTSVYGVVDGFFVSNYVGKIPFAAVNLIMPVLMLLGAAGFMAGTGGSAIVSKTLGEGKIKEAQSYFSLIVYAVLISGICFMVLGMIFLPQISVLIGARGEMLDNCVIYGRLILAALPAFMLQNVFQSFFVTAQKPQYGLIITVLAGFTNIFFDFLLVALLKKGIQGAAAATALSQLIGGFVPLLYFSFKNDSLLRLTRTGFYGRVLLKTCANGSSELMTNVSMSLVNILYNFQLMRLVGGDGVAAYGVIMYVSFVFVSMFIGYSIGSAPIVSYHYGAKNHSEVKGLLHKSLVITAVWGVMLTASACALAGAFAKIFVGYDEALFEMTKKGFMIYSFSYLFSGFGIYGSAFFTALNNGAVSAAISFLRTLLFQIAAVLILPAILGLNGIWLAISAADALAAVFAFLMLRLNSNKYYY